MSQVLKALPYGAMVANLFKAGASQAEELIHAAIGLSGEAGELADASTMDNVIEELGDAEFYLEAYLQRLGRWSHENLEKAARLTTSDRPRVSLGTVTHELSVATSALLDATKKVWVYGRPVSGLDAFDELVSIRAILDAAYELLGVQRQVVLDANQAKLGKRFPEGVYSGADALARADKNGS